MISIYDLVPAIVDINQLKSSKKPSQGTTFGPHLSIAMVGEPRTHRVKRVIHIEPPYQKQTWNSSKLLSLKWLEIT